MDVVLLGTTGKLQPIFPRSQWTTGSNPVAANKDYFIPHDERFFLDQNTGVEYVYVLASKEPKPQLEKALDDLNKANQTVQPTGPMPLKEAVILTRDPVLPNRGHYTPDRGLGQEIQSERNGRLWKATLRLRSWFVAELARVRPRADPDSSGLATSATVRRLPADLQFSHVTENKVAFGLAESVEWLGHEVAAHAEAREDTLQALEVARPVPTDDELDDEDDFCRFVPEETWVAWFKTVRGLAANMRCGSEPTPCGAKD